MSYTPSDYSTCPGFLRDYLYYMLTIKGRSKLTVEGYFIDLRTFFRFLKKYKGLVPEETPLDEISIQDVPLSLAAEVTLSDVYEFLNYTFTEKSNNARTRARKVSALRGLYKYLTNNVGLIPTNPIEKLELPTAKQALPTYLNLEQCYDLLRTFDQADPNHPRDYCIVTLFLNCGMRLSELCGINLSDIDSGITSMRVVGKGNKERMIYLNDACREAIKKYLPVRAADPEIRDKDALFLSSRHTRISNKTVQWVVYKYLDEAGLGNKGYSAHKLRHTAATLMYRTGNVDVRVLKDILGHEQLNTTQIYTHVSDEGMRRAVDANPLAHARITPTAPVNEDADDDDDTTDDE